MSEQRTETIPVDLVPLTAVAHAIAPQPTEPMRTLATVVNKAEEGERLRFLLSTPTPSLETPETRALAFVFLAIAVWLGPGLVPQLLPVEHCAPSPARNPLGWLHATSSVRHGRSQHRRAAESSPPAMPRAAVLRCARSSLLPADASVLLRRRRAHNTCSPANTYSSR